MARSITTLFLIESLDGKISTGDNDDRDTDKDFHRITGIKEGLEQYYDLEKKTDLHSLNSGRVMEKIGINERTSEPKKAEFSFVIIDNKPHLKETGVEYLAKWVKTLYLVTTNKNHPAFQLKDKYPNIEIIYYEEEVNLENLLNKLKSNYEVDKLTIQSGGTLNAEWVRRGLIDYVSIVIAPCLIGGSNTQSLIGGESLHSEEDLKKLKALRLIKCDVLKDSFIHVCYEVIQNTKVLV